MVIVPLETKSGSQEERENEFAEMSFGVSTILIVAVDASKRVSQKKTVKLCDALLEQMI